MSEVQTFKHAESKEAMLVGLTKQNFVLFLNVAKCSIGHLHKIEVEKQSSRWLCTGSRPARGEACNDPDKSCTRVHISIRVSKH